MANFSPYLRTLMLRKVYTPDMFPMAPGDGALQVALTFDIPLVNADVADLSEPVGGNYSRVGYTMTSDYWDDNGFGDLTNTDTIFFPVVTALWGRIAGWALIDPAVNQIQVVGELLNPFITKIGMIPTIDSGVITLGIR
jgi:hypothetical protein